MCLGISRLVLSEAQALKLRPMSKPSRYSRVTNPYPLIHSQRVLTVGMTGPNIFLVFSLLFAGDVKNSRVNEIFALMNHNVSSWETKMWNVGWSEEGRPWQSDGTTWNAETMARDFAVLWRAKKTGAKDTFALNWFFFVFQFQRDSRFQFPID